VIGTGLRSRGDLVHAFARARHSRLHDRGRAEEDKGDQSAKQLPEEATDHEWELGCSYIFSSRSIHCDSAA
jgi:hypothetical protein